VSRSLLWSGAVLAVGAWQLGAGWADAVAALVFVGAVVATYALALAARAIRIPPGLTVLAVLALAVVGAYYAAPAPDPVTAVIDSLPRLLTAPRPAPVTPALLVPGVLLVVVVALVSALSARGRSLLVPAAGAAVLYLAAALLTAGRADPYGLGALVLLVLIVLGWVVLDRRAALLPASGLVLALAALALVAGLLPLGRPFEPRELVTPPVTDIAVASPLPKLASWAAQGDAELFEVRGEPVPLRLVALADYTGATWRAASLYGPIGTVAPPDLPDGARQARSRVEVTVGELDGPWLPTPGRPVALDSLDAGVVDPDSGSLVLPTGSRPGLSYTVESTVDAPEDTDLLTAQVPGADTARRYLALPGLPFSLAEYARRTVLEARTPFEKAVAIEEVVRAGRRPDAQAPVGSSYARLETFLFGAQGASGANAGTAEQFASAFAVLARAVGLPARVVVGFRPVTPDADGVAVVRAADVTAWPEVYFAGWGWVPFDPVAGTDSGPSSASRREVINRLATPTPTPSAPDTTAPPQPSTAPANDSAASAPASSNRWWLLLGVPPILVLALLGVLRATRRSRLRRAGPTGAWTYVLDSLLLAGRPPAPHEPAPAIAASLTPLTPEAVPLATQADHAAFAPTSSAPSPSAWLMARHVRAALKRTTPWYRRPLWAIDPRPLLPRRRGGG
jgi:transglutaminase-like putative cysteine protease